MAAPLWFVAALLPMVASQFVRLQQTDPIAWCLDITWLMSLPSPERSSGRS